MATTSMLFHGMPPSVSDKSWPWSGVQDIFTNTGIFRMEVIVEQLRYLSGHGIIGGGSAQVARGFRSFSARSAGLGNILR